MIENFSHDVGRQWIPVLLWICVIAAESTNTFSSANTGNFLYSVLALFGPAHVFGSMTWDRVRLLNGILRILGHFAGYGILSWLAFRAWRATLPARACGVWPWRWMALAVMLTTLIAGLDEWHQTFLRSRSGKLTDVVLDSVAALTVQSVIFAGLKMRRTAHFAGTLS